jgi:hypothetical protein
MRRLACVKQQVQEVQEIHQPPPQTAELCDHRGVVSCQAGAAKLTFRLAQRLPRCHTRRTKPSSTSHPSKRHRFPAEIISHGVWLYFRVCLSYREVEQLMAARGVTLTYEAERCW